MKKEPKFELEGGKEVLEKVRKLYKEKKELGGNTFEKLRNTFYTIVEKYFDVLEEVSVYIVPKENSDKLRLKVALEELLGVYKEILDGYTRKLQSLNEKIAILEYKIGIENIEQDGDMLILRTEANFRGDDLVYRPIKEWYEPLIQNIKNTL